MVTKTRTAPPSIRQLSTAECWQLLESQRLGRLALVDPAGEPQIYPVNFTSRDGALYLRSANDAKLRSIRAHRIVAFEVDGQEGADRWSVVVRGEAEQVQTDAEIRRSRETNLRSMSPTSKPFVVRVEARHVTGRRFPERAPDGDEVAVRLQTIDAVPETLPAAARRPHPIPHFSPITDA